MSQPSGLNKKLRGEPIGFSAVSFYEPHIGVAAGKAEKVSVISRPEDRRGTYTDRTSLVKPALVNCFLAT